MRNRFAISTVAMACAVVVATCSVSSAAARGPIASASRASVVKLMTIGPTNAPLFSLPSIPVGAQVAINQINKAGGINGHKVKLITCDDQNNPNTATQCARQAIQEKVAAIVGGLSGSDLKILPYLQQAHIPWVGDSTSDAYTQSNLFLTGNDGTSGYVAIGAATVSLGCKHVAIVLSAESIPAFSAEISAGVTAGGHSKVVGSYTPPATSPDWSSIVATARSAGADCIAAGTSPIETPGLIAAINSGPKLKLVLLAGGLPSTLLQQLGSAASGVYATTGFLPFTSNRGAVPTLKAKATALDPKIPLDVFTESGYASAEIVAHAAAKLKQITGPSVLKALKKVSKFNTGLGPVVTLTKPNPLHGFSRLFNAYNYLVVVKNSQLYLAQPKPISTKPGLAMLAASQ